MVPVQNVKQTVLTPVEVKETFSVMAYPNPSATEFNLVVNSKSNEPVTVRIMDMNGVVRGVSSQLSKSNTIKVGSNLIGGTYMAEIIQGGNKKIVKLVKLN